MEESHKWLKLGEHFISNKVVKVYEALGGRLPLGWSPFVKCYLEEDSQVEVWIRVIGSQGESYNFLAIIESASHMDGVVTEKSFQAGFPIGHQHTPGFGNNLCSLVEGDNEDGTSVFVFVPESIENPEGMRTWVVPSCVWLVGLETLNESYGTFREAIEQFQTLIKSFRSDAKREHYSIQLSLWQTRKVSKLPDNVIQDTTEIVDAISGDDAQAQWKLFPKLRFDPQKLIDSITIILGHHFVWYTIEEPCDLSVEVVHVQLRPTKAQTVLLEVSIHGQDSSTKAKDSEGARDTRAHKGRVRAQSKKGSKARQISASKPEEVTHQTLSDHHPDGYTAKHTHLGSLEDV